MRPSANMSVSTRLTVQIYKNLGSNYKNTIKIAPKSWRSSYFIQRNDCPRQQRYLLRAGGQGQASAFGDLDRKPVSSIWAAISEQSYTIQCSGPVGRPWWPSTYALSASAASMDDLSALDTDLSPSFVCWDGIRCQGFPFRTRDCTNLFRTVSPWLDCIPGRWREWVLPFLSKRA